MTPDPTIDEIRRIRHEISREVGHDLRLMKDQFAELEARFTRPSIDRDGQRTRDRRSADAVPAADPR